MDAAKTTMDNLLQKLSGLSAGHEKALKQGIYNAVALFLLCVVCAAGYGLYIVLSPFLKPLVWALLCGAVLFPIKASLATIVHSWFSSTEESHKPFLLSVSLVPINIFDNISELIGTFLQAHVKYIVSATAFFTGLLMVYNYTPSILSYFIWRLFSIFNTILSFFIALCNIYVLSAVILGYISLLYLYWTPNNNNKFRKTSFGIWCMISLYVSNALGAYPTFVFCGIQVLFLIGFVYEISILLEQPEIEGQKLSVIGAVKCALTNDQVSKSSNTEMSTLVEDESLLEESEKSDTTENKEEKPKRLPPKPFLKTTGRSMSMIADVNKPVDIHPNRRAQSANNVLSNKISIADRYFLRKFCTELRLSLDLEDDSVDTDKYMYGAMYACVGMILWKHKWILAILVVPIAYYCLKKFYSYFGIKDIVLCQCQTIINSINVWCQERHQALVPVNINGLYKISIIVDQKITQLLKCSVDAITTTAVIVALIIFVICATIFMTIQIYTEGVHLVKISGEILNSTLMNNPDIDWVPQQLEESVNSVLDNVYTYGRSAISNGIQKLVKDLDAVKAEQMEKKFLELWDRLYQAWMMSNDSDKIGPTVDVDVAYSAWESLKEGFGKAPLQLFNMSSIQNFVKENIGTFMSVLDSIWSIVKGNISVVLGMVTELMYIVLMGGSAILNFALSTIVFFTALFYLLNSSDKTYKPIELISNLSPISCHRFAVALQESVIGVFTATFKMAAFFGMWTWFIHNLFEVKIIYLPTVFATTLGAVPFVDVSIACIPATIELWFTQGAFIAVIFFLLHFLAFSYVITEFYKEIKGGGHPYLTGLSIAGGIFCLGIEGAIFGPLLLCCIMVAINLSRRYLQSPTEEAIKTIKSQSLTENWNVSFE